MLFSNQTNPTFPKKIEPLDCHDCSKVGLIGQGFKKTSKMGSWLIKCLKSKYP